MARIISSNLVYGVKDPLPLSEFPDGRIKIKMRNNDFASAYVRGDKGIRQFYIEEKDGCWIPKYEQSANFRP
jgi:hypothetical protein